MEILKINGVAIQNPSSIEWQIYDLDSEEGSGRSQEGLMFRDRKAIKRKIVCKFPPMTDVEISQLLQTVEPQFFQLEYPDARKGSRRTMECYVGDRTSPIFKYDPVLKTWLWQELSMNFIER